MKKGLVGLCVLFVIFAGCMQKSNQENQSSSNQQEETQFKAFPIYTNIGSRDNHYIPSGFMPDGQCLDFNDRWQESCHSERTCIKVIYDVECSRESARWAGIYWQNPAHNWGSRKGGYNLNGATKLTFWAKGEKGGERIEEIKMGGVTGDYPDTDSAFIGPVILTNEWKEYSIDLRGKDLTYVSGGFSWSTNVDVNPESCTFYLDDIRYE
ncbi:MAG: hypothetical protein P9M07_08595 [Candidatus Aceula meridiana]|nr:hypothetical protein [Candidatus Aceula meridiana]